MRLEHYNIRGPMPFLEEVRDFYVELIGLSEGPRPDTPVRGYWLYAGSHPAVHLAESDRHNETLRPSHLDHIAFSCKGYDAVSRRLDRAGMDYRTNRVQSAGLIQIFLHDPAGIRLELNFYGEDPDTTGQENRDIGT